MSAKTGQNFQIYQGENKALAIPILKPDKTPLDLTGKHLLYRVAKSPEKHTTLLEKRLDGTHSEIIISGASSNVANLQFVHDDTHEQKPFTFYHELRVTDPDTLEELVVMLGDWRLDQSLTNTDI